ncbi:helix-turn-helix transcriptional regulator [Georgenia alba]|uniref:Helix-turn-helix transcriptional regulator n=1 Tax=Georgenia alba TaxID=2233858 RepID=A0ABW2QE17_9MICO
MTPDRFFSLVLLLESREAVTTQDLASALGVSLRTVTRDLNWLRDAGFPLTTQRGRLGGVTMLPGAGLDLTRLTPGEREHLSLTGLDERQRSDLNAAGESQRALAKITATRASRAEGLLPLAEIVHVDSRAWRQPRADGPTPASLIGPVRRGRQLRIEYASARGPGSREFVVDPYGLLDKAGTWYLVADYARVPRMYRLERIATWSELARPRRTRKSETLTSVVDALLEQWERDHAVEVSATIDPSQAERAQRIFGQQLLRANEDGCDASGQVTIYFQSLEDVRALLPFGSSITVHSPREAKDRLRDLAIELADHYTATSTS